MYDGSTAMWEAIVMGHRITRRNEDDHLVRACTRITSASPRRWRSSPRTGSDTSLPQLTAETDAEQLIAAIDGETSAVVVQYPDILGRITDLTPIAEAAHANGALLIAVVTEPVALGLIRSPGEMGADIVVGRGPVDRRRPAVRRPLCRPVRHAREICPPDAGPPRRRDRRCGGQARLRPDPVDARAAYPPREGDVEHLHQLRPLRPGLLGAHEPARREGAAAACSVESRARVRGRRSAGGDSRRPARQRRLLQ